MWAEIAALWEDIIEWFATQIPKLEPIFWDATNSKLTLLGTFCLISIGVGLCFLVIRLIQNFVSLRS